MTLLTNSRKKLDAALADDETTLFLILDDPDEVAEAVHDKAEEIAEPREWRRVFLIREVELLSADERKLWFDEPGHYAVVGGKEKVVAMRAPLTDVVLPNGTPIAMKIRTAFNLGDHLK
jgi:hypothetical protein